MLFLICSIRLRILLLQILFSFLFGVKGFKIRAKKHSQFFSTLLVSSFELLFGVLGFYVMIQSLFKSSALIVYLVITPLMIKPFCYFYVVHLSLVLKGFKISKY